MFSLLLQGKRSQSAKSTLKPAATHCNLRVQKTAQSGARVLFGDNLRLDWDGRGRVLLKLGPEWAGHTCGLCGNYNGNQGDDFMSAAGLVESGPQAFGQSWRINGDCDSTHRQDTDPCSLNPKRGVSLQMSLA
nr:von Willebrand factor-like [Salvelinus alpinus]